MTSIATEQPLHPQMRELYRKASAEEKLAVVARLNAALIALKEAHLKSRHPDWPEAARRAELRRWWFSARD